MANLPNCPKCGDEYTYEDGHMFICPMCGNEWTAADAQAAAEAGIIRDANGNELADGDTVVVVKDLKVKGAGILKQGTRVKYSPHHWCQRWPRYRLQNRWFRCDGIEIRNG